MSREAKKGQPLVDILEINRLRRQLLFQSYMWDHRLIYAAASLEKNSITDDLSESISEYEDKPQATSDKLIDINRSIKPDKGLNSCDALVVDEKLNKDANQGWGIYSLSSLHDTVDQGTDVVQDSNHVEEDQVNLPAGGDICDQPDPLESGVVVRRTLSEGQFPIVEDLSHTLDAAWIGENHPGAGTPKDNSSGLPDLASGDSSIALLVPEKLDFEDNADERIGLKVTLSLSSLLPAKSQDTVEDSASWSGMSFLNFYRAFNKNFLGSAQKLDTLGEYNPVYVSSFREQELQGGARLLLPVGVNDTVIPVYDSEPTSIICYALVSPQYHAQLSDEGERPRDMGESMTSFSLSDSVNFQSFLSFDETASEALKSFHSIDDSFLSMTGSRSSLVSDPFSYAKSLHARVFFSDDSPLGKVKYTVTCYYAKRFEALRRICCPSELDFLRSLCRCKKWGAQGGKSNVFFAKSLDDRFIIKQVTKTELESFIKFAPAYFKYLSESISSGSPTCLAKILGIFQVLSEGCTCQLY